MDLESADTKTQTQLVKDWVTEKYGDDMLLRDRAFCLALEAIETMPAIADESNETPESMIAITMKLANEIFNFLKGNQNV